MAQEKSDSEVVWYWMVRVLGVIGLVTAAILGGCPQYNVYSARLQGEAVQAQAHGARQALVSQAEAERDAAKMRAEAIAIVGQAAKDFPEYRTQEFIGAFAEAMHNGKINQIIYVPTEANVPILEAGHRPK
jgi:regulator of protease activity HflC (stomatin/prohibitin superfamily)